MKITVRFLDEEEQRAQEFAEYIRTRDSDPANLQGDFSSAYNED
jgi:hypothetical protein